MRFWYYICNRRKTSSLSYKIEVLVVHLNPNKTETPEELLSVSDNTSDHWIFVQLPLTLDKYRDVRAEVSIISVKWSCDYHLQSLFCCCHYHWPCRNHCQCHCYCHYFWTVIVNCQSFLTVAVIITVIAIVSVTVTVIVFVSAPVSVAVTGCRKAHTVRVKCLVHGHSTTIMTRPKLKDLPIQNPAYWVVGPCVCQR